MNVTRRFRAYNFAAMLALGAALTPAVLSAQEIQTPAPATPAQFTPAAGTPAAIPGQTPAALPGQTPQVNVGTPAAGTPAALPGTPAAGTSAALPGTPAAAAATPFGATPAAGAPTPAPTPFDAGTPAAGAVTPAATAFAPASGVSSEARQRAFDPVRQAIARRDFTAAQQALEALRQQYPNDPALATFDQIIQAGLAGSSSPTLIPTPRAGYTPLPTAAPTPTPTPEPTPAPVETDAEAPGAAQPADTAAGTGQQLLDNPMVRYALYALAAIIALLVLFMLFRKKKTEPQVDESEEITPPPGTLEAVQPGSFDMSPSTFDTLESPPATDFSAMNDTGAGGAALGGAAMSSGSEPQFTTFGFDDEDEEPAPKKPVIPKPAPSENEDIPLNFDDSPTAIIQPAEPEGTDQIAPASDDRLGDVHAAPSDVSFESLGIAPPSSDNITPAGGISSGGLGNQTPAGGLSSTPGDVNLDDLMGDQTAPADADPNSGTLPTFVSQPNADNPEESVDIPGKGMRPPPADDKDLTISFDELFGAKEADQPAPAAPAPADEPPPAAASTGDTSLEDALAATLSDMEASAPDASGATPPPPAGNVTPQSNETLDERTERMFREQMEKARAAVAEKNWRQAVHVLSIASALHPEDEEARQMLREARAEKRKAEESV